MFNSAGIIPFATDFRWAAKRQGRKTTSHIGKIPELDGGFHGISRAEGPFKQGRKTAEGRGGRPACRHFARPPKKKAFTRAKDGPIRERLLGRKPSMKRPFAPPRRADYQAAGLAFPSP
jgi:hypothetical protein